MTSAAPVVSPRSSRSTAVSEDDWAFCDATLPKVSRTFALSIAALPVVLRQPIAVAYLLCRAVDTIEDDAEVKGAEREALYDRFDALLLDDAADASGLEEQVRQRELGAGADRELCLEVGRVFRCFRALPLEQRAAIRPHVLEMSRGMRETTRQADAEGELRLETMDELERYCYFVAGTVGKLLTALFELHVAQLPEPLRTPLRGRAVSFGLALQLVNIVKDVATDHTRGDCFLPRAWAQEEGTTLDGLLDPERREEGLRLIRRVCGRARTHLRRAEEYTLLWPQDDPRAREVRLFCAVPLVLALATLDEVEKGADTLKPGSTPKVSRAVVGDVFARAQDAAASDDVLLSMFETHGGGTATVMSSASGPTPRRAGDASTTPARASDDGRLLQRFRGKALVTGAAGHLGANMVHRLLEEGVEVRVLLREGSDNTAMDGLDVDVAWGDLRDASAAAKAVEGCQTVFHCAAHVSTLQGDADHKRRIFESNVRGTRNLLRAAKAAGVERVAVTGSFGANGYDLDDPTRPVTEDEPFYPFATHLPYARTKAHMEHEVLRAIVEHDVDAVMCTSTAILGPHDYKPSRMGRTLVDFTHGRLRAYIPGGFEFVAARDLCDGHLLALEKGRKGHKYTFATEFLELDQIMDIWEQITGVPRPRIKLPARAMHGLAHVSSFVLTNFFPRIPQRFTPDAVRILRLGRRADITKARTELGYAPGDIRDAMREAYDDFARRGLVPPRRVDIVDEPAAAGRARSAA